MSIESSIEVELLDSKKEPENIIHPTIDVVKSMESGEFGPIVLALINDYISMEFMSPDGYNILHQAVAYNAKEIIYFLVEKLNFPLDMLSHCKQSPLMIASTFGFIELMKYFLDHSANISLTDECNFDALFYALKQGETTSVLYLLHRGSDIMLKDNNGCGVVHWAAYKNNLFLLRLFKRFNLPLNENDFHGFKPIDRAITNSSFDSVKFLLDNIQETIPFLSGMNMIDIENDEIRTYLTQRLQIGNRRRDKFKKIMESYRKIIVFIGYFTLMVLMIANFSNNSKYFEHFYSVIVIFGLWVYLICFIGIFLFQKEKNEENKVGSPKNIDCLIEKDDFLENLRTINKENMSLYSFFHLDHLISQDVNLNDYTILHYIVYLIDSFQFIKILDIDYNRICPTCLIFKPPKTKHCSICNKCVVYYHHHSLIFNRCFNYKNHVFYIGLLILQEILFSIFLKVTISSYYDERKSWVLLIIPEITYLIIKDQGLFWGGNFLVNLALWGYNSGFLFIELYGLANNLTFNEIMNRLKYRYLYRKEKTKKGKIIYVYENCTSKGFFSNIKNYIKRCFL